MNKITARFITVREVATIIGTSGKHIYDLARSGLIPHYRFNGAIRFDPAEIEEWIKARYKPSDGKKR